MLIDSWYSPSLAASVATKAAEMRQTEVENMTVSANIGSQTGGFFARLQDGRTIARQDLQSMARALVLAGVQVHGLSNDWMSGYCMLTAGQNVALRSEMLDLERYSVGMAAEA